MERYKTLTLLHSNDMHGDFFAEKVDEKLVGGVSMLSGYIKKTKKEQPNTLYCIAGDMFRGSVIDSEYQGLSTIGIMNKLAPDIVTIGNHETDYGLAHLLFIEKCANFPIINANLHITMNQKRLFRPYEIINVDGMKILFIGVITEEVLSQTKSDGIVGTFVDINDAKNEIGKICNAFNAIDIDFTVLLTHIGFEEDKKLAEILDPAWGIDVIIGGHSHTFLDKPEIVNNIPIVQAGIGTDQIGRFDIVVDTDNNCIDSFTWSTIPIEANTCPKDEEIENYIKDINKRTSEKYDRVVCKFPTIYNHETRFKQTELGSLIADVLQEAYGLDVFLLASGYIRKEKAGPTITYGGMCELLPYTDKSYYITITGEQFKRMIEYMCRDETFDGSHSEYYQLSKGLEIVYDRNIHSITTLKLNNKNIINDQILTVGLTEFHLNNIYNSFNITSEEISKIKKPRIVSTNTQDVFDEVLTKSNLVLDENWQSRMTIIQKKEN